MKALIIYLMLETGIRPGNLESKDLEETANDLRASANVLRDSLLKQSNVIASDVLVKLVSIVSNLDVIADSLDESSPAITDVLTPDEPAGNKIIKKNWLKKLWPF